MKNIVIDLKCKSNTFQIVPLGDMHVGDAMCNMPLIKDTIKYIEKTPNCYTILNGDLMNNALKTSKSDSYMEQMTMEQEQDTIIELLMPIKDKILFIAQGNHEYRTKVAVGIDPLRYVARSLGLMQKDRYGDNSYGLILKFGKNCGTKVPNKYRIFGIHGGGGGGRRLGSSMNALEEMTKVVGNADLYLHSHTHTCINASDRVFEFDDKSDKLISKIRTFFNTTAFLNYGGYAEQKGYKVTDNVPRTLRISAVRVGNKMEYKTDIIKI